MPSGTFPSNIQQTLKQQNTFSSREVGFTHPDAPAFVRLTDTGDIEIMAGDGLGIIINKKNSTITLMANTIRFMTTDSEGLAWNNLFFNSNAVVYSQPALNPAIGTNIHNVFAGAENYYNSSQTQMTTSIAGDQQPGTSTIITNSSEDLTQISQTGGTAISTTGVTNPNTNPFPEEANP